MKIAITAASGKLGAEIVNATAALIGKNNVIGVARTPSNANLPGITVLPGDYNAASDLESAFAGIDAVLLVSGMDTPEKRIEQHRNVIRAARNAGVKKIVYTSIQGPGEGTAFSPVVQSNRQTEKDIQNSGMDWVIGRNGIYMEPDVEYIDNYKKRGAVCNCAGDGRCGYTTRPELAYAYARMLTEEHHNGKIYNLHGEAITQNQLVGYLNNAFDTNLIYTSMGVEDYRKDRIDELGEFIGTIITGIYQGIREGKFDNKSHYEEAAGRAHQSWDDYFDQIGKRKQIK